MNNPCNTQIINVIKNTAFSPNRLKLIKDIFLKSMEKQEQRMLERLSAQKATVQPKTVQVIPSAILPRRETVPVIPPKPVSQDLNWRNQTIIFFNTLQQLRVPKNSKELREHEKDIHNFAMFKGSSDKIFVMRFCVVFCDLVKKEGGYHKVMEGKIFPKIVKRLKKLCGIPREIVCSVEMCLEIYEQHILGFEMRGKKFFRKKQARSVAKPNSPSGKKIVYVAKNPSKEVKLKQSLLPFQKVQPGEETKMLIQELVVNENIEQQNEFEDEECFDKLLEPQKIVKFDNDDEEELRSRLRQLNNKFQKQQAKQNSSSQLSWDISRFGCFNQNRQSLKQCQTISNQ